MTRPTIDEVISELEPKHTARNVWIALFVVMLVAGGAIAYFWIKQPPPPDPAVLIADAKALIKTEKFAQAIDKLEKVYELDQTNVEACGLLVYANDGLGDRPQTIKWAKKLVELKPNDVMAHQRFAYLLEEEEKIKEAIEQWKTILSLDPENRHAQSKLEELVRWKPEKE